MLTMIFPMLFVYLIAALLYYNLRVFLRTADFEMLGVWDCIQSHVFGIAVTGVFYYLSR